MEIDGIEYRLADTREDIEGAMRLVYSNYVDMAYCDRNWFEMYLYLFDLLPETRTLVAVRNKEVLGTLTLVFDSDFGIPSDHLYRAELEKLRIANRRIVELSKLAINRNLAHQHFPVLNNLYRMAWIFSGAIRHMTDFCILIEPSHESFYSNRLLLERIGALREDTAAHGAPGLLMRLNFDGLEDRFIAAYSGKPQSKNLHWFMFKDPACKRIELEISNTDRRLTDLNRRLKAREFPAGSSSDLSETMSTFLDFRIFVIKVVIERIMESAQNSGDLGRFKDQVESYENLVAAIPVNYMPDTLAKIYEDMAMSSWYCGMYEKTLEYARKMRELSKAPDLTASSHRIAGMALHFLSRRKEALEALHRGLATPGISEISKARLLRMEGRFAIDSLQLDKAAEFLDTAKTIAESLPDSKENNQLKAALGHDGYIIASRQGDILGARTMLDWSTPALAEAGIHLKFMYLEARAMVSRHLGRPEEALKYCQSAAEHIALDSNPFNASILFCNMSSCHLAIGEIGKAKTAARRALTYAQRSRAPNAISTAAMILIEGLLLDDSPEEAEDLLKDILAGIDKNASPRAWANIESCKALIAIAAGNFGDAKHSYEIVETLIGAEPSYLSSTRIEIARVKLSAGDTTGACKIFDSLPAVSTYPGNLIYASKYHGFKSVIEALHGDTAKAMNEFKKATEKYMEGGAAGSAAEVAWAIIAEATGCGLKNVPGSLIEAAWSLIARVVEAHPIPFFARKLKESLATNS